MSAAARAPGPLLTRQQAEQARFWHRKRPALEYAIPLAFYVDRDALVYASLPFVEAVASFQQAHGLKVDGKAGPKETIPAMAAAYAPMSRTSDVLVMGGRPIAVPGCRVVNPQSPEGYSFNRYKGHTHGRFPRPPVAAVYHDSVTRTVEACFRALLTIKDQHGRNAGYGTQIIVSPSGTIYQVVDDLLDVTWHAGRWNEHALGIDVANLLEPSLAPHSPLRRPATSWADRGYIDWTPEQKRAVVALTRVLHTEAGLVYDCPRTPDGRPDTRAYGDAVPNLKPGFRGFVAHGQITRKRWDGNVGLLEAFGGQA